MEATPLLMLRKIARWYARMRWADKLAKERGWRQERARMAYKEVMEQIEEIGRGNGASCM